MQLSPSTPCVISGGASGLGAACARALRRLGCPVAILDRDAGRGAALAKDIGAGFHPADVTDAAAIADSLAAARACHGPARLAIACAGIAPGAKTVGREGAHDPEVFARVLAVNLTGTFNLLTQAAAAMADAEPLPGGERGVLIATASIAAYEGQIGQIAYAASKGGVASMMLPMARDLAGLGIRAVAIAPGLFRTPMVEGLPQEVQDSLGGTVPFPARLGDPSEFASLALHIAGNPMLNGEVIRLDGALRMAPR